MFKYFFPCPKQELTVGGNMELLDLDALGEARTAMQDCTKVGSQCMLSDLGIHCLFGPGAMLDPFPVNQPHPSFGDPMGESGWAWMEFPWKGKIGRIGFKTASPPTPEYLRRRDQITGYMIDDAFGRQWRMPTARDRKNAYGNLPTHMIPEANDEWTRRLDDRYRWLWDLAAEVWEALECFYSQGSRPEFAFPWFPKQVAKILSVNYRIGTLELRALGCMNLSLLTDDFCMKSGEALVDWQAMESYLRRKEGAEPQKKTSDMSPPNSLVTTGVGGDASTPPALANSG